MQENKLQFFAYSKIKVKSLDIKGELASSAYKNQSEERLQQPISRFWQPETSLEGLCVEYIATKILENPSLYADRAEKLPEELNNLNKPKT